jgi:predicted nucleic acid-binding protein
VIFVDSNVPMYLIGSDRGRKIDAERLIARFASERRRLVTSSEVFQELLHRYARIEAREAIEVAFHALASIVDNVFSVRREDLFAAKDLTHANPRLSSRDAVHAAVMHRVGASEILSFDRGFDLLPDIVRIPGPGS